MSGKKILLHLGQIGENGANLIKELNVQIDFCSSRIFFHEMIIIWYQIHREFPSHFSAVLFPKM